MIVYPNYVTDNQYSLWDENENYPADCSVSAMDANARLFTAAPEMLEALRLMLKADETICENIGKKSDQAMLRIAALDAARAAIAKATGVERD